MKNFFIVIKFELLNLVKSRPFKISTLILSLLVIVGLSVPTIMDNFEIGPFRKNDENSISVEKDSYGVIINNESIEFSNLEKEFPNSNLIKLDNERQLENLILSSQVKAGFVVKTPTKYHYIAKNTSIQDNTRLAMDSALLSIFRSKSLADHGIDSHTVKNIYSIPVEHELRVLGKDSVKNYAYTYVLSFAIYFIIMIYGQLTATTIASEKSNRTMEILITSTNTESLIFGKVIASALAGIFQFLIILSMAKISYKLNASAWDGALDLMFKIPTDVLLTFSIFGILGYLFYLFIYGAIGALVSRTEDVSSSITLVMIIFIASFFVATFGMQFPNNKLLKIASFIPFSSFMAMFVRVSMGEVGQFHILISLLILGGSTLLVGIIGSKIYRLGTLMYGNPVKLTTAIRLLREKEQ